MGVEDLDGKGDAIFDALYEASALPAPLLLTDEEAETWAAGRDAAVADVRSRLGDVPRRKASLCADGDPDVITIYTEADHA